MLSQVFERFIQNGPLSVMVRGTLERVLGAEQLDQFYEHTANTHYTRERLFSTMYDLMRDVVFRQQFPLGPNVPIGPMSEGSPEVHFVPQESRLIPPTQREAKRGMIPCHFGLPFG